MLVTGGFSEAIESKVRFELYSYPIYTERAKPLLKQRKSLLGIDLAGDRIRCRELRSA